jgi:hypothetical protein
LTREYHRLLPTPTSKHAVEVRPKRGRFRGASIERVGREPRSLILVNRREAAAGKGQELRLHVRCDDVDIAVVRSHRDL